jgi:hypothetical protein
VATCKAQITPCSAFLGVVSRCEGKVSRQRTRSTSVDVQWMMENAPEPLSWERSRIRVMGPACIRESVTHAPAAGVRVRRGSTPPGASRRAACREMWNVRVLWLLARADASHDVTHCECRLRFDHPSGRRRTSHSSAHVRYAFQ